MGRRKKRLTQEEQEGLEQELHIASVEADCRAKAEKARASHEPTAKERKLAEAKRAMEEAARELEDQAPVDMSTDDDEMLNERGKPIRNPRTNPDRNHKGEMAAARSDRRRRMIWEARERWGMPQRRKIYDKDGTDTGATTGAI
jgi:hypothetical protein